MMKQAMGSARTSKVFGGTGRSAGGTLAVLGVLAVCSSSRADVLYNGFASTSGLTINGSAGTSLTGDGTVLRLTPAVANSAGSAFSTAKVSTDNFTSVFSFRITAPGGTLFDNNVSNGADGFVFVVQNQANNVGSIGQGIGYQGITPSVGIAYDTWLNPEHNDPSQNYVGIDLNGSVDHNASNGPTTTLAGDEMGNGNRWWSWVFYDGARLRVYLTESASTTPPNRPATPNLDYAVNLHPLLGESTAYVGFTSGTGADWENHDILYWSYSESVPEPTCLGGGLLGCVGAALRRRR